VSNFHFLLLFYFSIFIFFAENKILKNSVYTPFIPLHIASDWSNFDIIDDISPFIPISMANKLFNSPPLHSFFFFANSFLNEKIEKKIEKNRKKSKKLCQILFPVIFSSNLTFLVFITFTLIFTLISLPTLRCSTHVNPN